jgi:hypothetical protein
LCQLFNWERAAMSHVPDDVLMELAEVEILEALF